MTSPFAYTSLYFDSPPQMGRALDLWPVREGRPLTIVFIHGGGWRQGRRDQMHPLMQAFHAEGYSCVSLDYRLAGVNAFDQLADVREGLALAQDRLRDHDLPQDIVLYGSSAGGHLALLAGLKDRPASVAGIVASCAPITFEPWPDIFPGSWDSIQDAAGALHETSPDLYRQLSPARHASKESPPLLFLLGECEHMFPNHLTIELVKNLQASGGQADYRVYPAAEHGFFYSLERRNQQMAFQDVIGFLQQLESKLPA